jgi:hypothetical protein
MATAMSSVSCISGAKLFSAAAAPHAARRSAVQRITATAPKQTQPEITAPNPDVVPPNVLECKDPLRSNLQSLSTLYIL